MLFRSFLAVFLTLTAIHPRASADFISIQQVPVLNVNLPAGSTWEVQQSSDGVAWVNTGVLAASAAGTPHAVRLDGFSRASFYRLLNVTNGTVSAPGISAAPGLLVTSPGASEVYIQSSTNLLSTSWVHAGYVFPGVTGELRAGISSPLPPKAFFRSAKPANPLISATVTYYQQEGSAGAAGFELVADDMPELYRQGYTCAACPEFYHKDGSASAAGECYEFRGPFGAVTAMVADVIGSAPAGFCNEAGTYFDLGTPAFSRLFPLETGIGLTTRKLVPAPVEGPIKLAVVNNSGGYYFELRPYNYRAGVTNLEIRGSGMASFVPLPRSTYNSFVWNGSPPAMPLTIRVTSRFGEAVTFPPASALNTGDRLTAAGQFSFPDPGPATVWRVPPVFVDSLNNVPGGRWTSISYGGITTDAAYSGDAYQGSASFRIGDLNAWSGIFFQHEQSFANPDNGFLEFSIKSGTTALVTNLMVQVSGSDLSGSTTNSLSMTLPGIGNSWRTFRIPLEPILPPAKINQIHIRNNTAANQGAVLVDSMRISSYTQPQ